MMRTSCPTGARTPSRSGWINTTRTVRSSSVRKPIIAVLAAATVLMGTAACAEIAEPDKVGLYYMEGQSDGYKFDHCIDPGAVDDAIWNNSVVWLPNHIRTWNIAPEGGDTK